MELDEAVIYGFLYKLRPKPKIAPPPPSLHAYRPDDKVLRERYSVGDNVRNYGNGPKWMSSVVIEQRGPLLYTVQLKSGLLCRDTKIS